MGVIFQSGMAIGAVPGFSNYGIPRSWILGTEDFGCQPAWDNGVLTLLPPSTGCTGTADLISVFDGIDPDFGFYISGIDSTGTNQTAFLVQAIGQAGTMTFTQGSASITIGFDETTFGANQYSAADGLYYDGNNGTAPYYISGTGTFYGFNNAGQGTNSVGGSGEQYFVQPSNSQLLTISINVGVTPTPTPTATASVYYYNVSGYSCGNPCTLAGSYNVMSPTPLTIGYFYNNPENRGYTFEILSSISPISGAYDLTGELGFVDCVSACTQPTPTPTATSTPTPTPTAVLPTPTPTPTNNGVGSWYFYSDEGNINAQPPNANGNAIFTITGGTIVETFNPNKVSGVTYLYFDVKDSSGTDYTSFFSGYTGGTGTITISQNGDTATYTSTTPGSFAILSSGGGNNFFAIATPACTQTKDSNATYVYTDPISITFGS